MCFISTDGDINMIVAVADLYGMARLVRPTSGGFRRVVHERTNSPVSPSRYLATRELRLGYFGVPVVSVVPPDPRQDFINFVDVAVCTVGLRPLGCWACWACWASLLLYRAPHQEPCWALARRPASAGRHKGVPAKFRRVLSRLLWFTRSFRIQPPRLPSCIRCAQRRVI